MIKKKCYEFSRIQGPQLPWAEGEHCMVQWNDTYTMMIGGFKNPTFSSFYDWTNGVWLDGPQLSSPHLYHGCVVTEGK